MTVIRTNRFDQHAIRIANRRLETTAGPAAPSLCSALAYAYAIEPMRAVVNGPPIGRDAFESEMLALIANLT